MADHHDVKEPATTGQIVLSILGGAFPVLLALFLVYELVGTFATRY
ncbi:MAG: hypothetical protein ACOY5C_01385 [Pseudomonadota bacterium]|nr:hypothetical protein [Thermithiobacillus tepidarius]